jgi:hypothetical protein
MFRECFFSFWFAEAKTLVKGRIVLESAARWERLTWIPRIDEAA